MKEVEVITLDSANMVEHGCYCLRNKKLPGFKKKLSWLSERFDEGLKLKILHSQEEGQIGMIEYVSGECSWRGFSDPDYLFIHCIYIGKKIHRNRNYGKLLIDQCLEEARALGKKGVAVISSGKAMLAENNIFLKNGFAVADKRPPAYELLVRQFDQGPLPAMEDNEISDSYREGLHLLVADQCPYFQKSIDAIDKTAKKYGLELNIVKISTAKEAQQAPSLYGVFNLIYKGELIAEHYISEKRFKNILEEKMS